MPPKPSRFKITDIDDMPLISTQQKFRIKVGKSSPKQSRFKVRTLKKLVEQNPNIYQLHMNQKRKSSPKKSRFKITDVDDMPLISTQQKFRVKVGKTPPKPSRFTIKKRKSPPKKF